MITLGTILSIGPVKAFASSTLWAVFLALSANVCLTILLLMAIGLITALLRPLPETCPACGKKMGGGGAFYDFCLVPTLQEIVFFVVYLGILIGARILIS